MTNLQSKKIIFTITNDLTYDQRMLRICSTLATEGYQIQLVGRQLSSSIPFDNSLFTAHRFRLLFNKGKLFYIEYNIRLFFWLLMQRFDCVCGIDLDTILPCYFVAILRGKQCVYDAHELYSETPEVIRRPLIHKVWLQVERFIVPRVKYRYTVSQSVADEFERRYGTKFELIRNLPVVSEQSTANKNEQLIDKNLLPADKILLPADKNLLPTDKILLPADKNLLPTDKILLPADKILLPTDKNLLPADKNLSPADKVLLPADKVLLPADKVLLPADKILSPADKNLSPTDKNLPFTVLYQGNLNEGRGLETAVEAMQYIENAQLWIVGDGDLMSLLRGMVSDRKLENKVKFWGYVEPKNLPAITRQASVGLNIAEGKSLSYQLSLSNKTTDYIQSGLPQIFINFIEFQRINDEYNVGVMIDKLEVQTLVTALKSLLDNPEAYNTLKENCLRAAKVLNWENEKVKLITFYKQLLVIRD